MKLYRILLPLQDNAGQCMKPVHYDWTRIATGLIGGLTRLPEASGQWLDKATGILHVDTVIPYELACTPMQFAQLVKLAHNFFPDQIAIHIQEIGVAFNHEASNPTVFGWTLGKD